MLMRKNIRKRDYINERVIQLDSIHFTFITIIIFVIALWQIEVNKLKGKLGSLEKENNRLRITKKVK
jgi:hypothetical protein